MVRWAIRLLVGVLGAIALVVGGGAYSAVRRLPDLQPWHQLQSTLEPTAADITPSFTFDEYLRREEAVFREARERVEIPASANADPSMPNRYVVKAAATHCGWAPTGIAPRCSTRRGRKAARS